jgi:hypothetical protein
VLGKSADQVANVILTSLGSAARTGCVVILVGLSGTGKGTTVLKLKGQLPNAMTWSNGNIFRALTLLAVRYCEICGLPEVGARRRRRFGGGGRAAVAARRADDAPRRRSPVATAHATRVARAAPCGRCRPRVPRRVDAASELRRLRWARET